MNLWESMNGLLRVELTSADGPGALKAINHHQIPILRLEQVDDLTCAFFIRRRDWKGLKKLCDRRGDSLKLRGRRGIYWTGKGLLRRPVLVLGVVFLLALGLFLPSRVLFLRVEGNETIPARQILEAAGECGVGFGASRRYVRSEKVKNALLGAIPELGWAGVNTSGCTAVISVRERTASQEAAAPMLPEAIVAQRDGYILSADVTQGTALFQPGEVVRKGQTLISGYTDCGICIRATGAQGEVFAQTRRDLQAVTPADYGLRREKTAVRRKYSLRFQKKRINLWKDSGICDTTCGRMYKEYHITLPGGFRLPVAVCVEEDTCWDVQPQEPEESEAEAVLTDFAEAYLNSQMISGKILGKQEDIFREETLYRMEAAYDCTEMIGRASKIGEGNGKRD